METGKPADVRCMNCGHLIVKYPDVWNHFFTGVSSCDIEPWHGPKFAASPVRISEVKEEE